MEPFTVTRSIHLDADVRRVWESLADDAGLAGWLADAVELEVVPGAAGRLLDAGGAERRVVVTEVTEGRRLGFAWWNDDDPAQASSVVITVDGDDDATTVTVTETLDASAFAGSGIGGPSLHVAGIGEASVGDLFGHLDGWAGRLGRLADALAPLPAALRA